MSVDGDPAPPRVARPPRGRRRRAPAPATSSSSFAGNSRHPPAGDPRPRVRHRGDGPVAGAAAAGAAALGAPRLGRRPAADRRGRPPARPPARRSRSRPAGPTSPGSRPDDLAGASLITASALLDLMTGDALDGLIDVCADAGCPGAAGTVGRRPGRAGPGGSARRPGRGRVRRPPAPDDGERPRCSARTPSQPPRTGSAGGGPRCTSGPAPGGSAPPRPTWRRSG